MKANQALKTITVSAEGSACVSAGGGACSGVISSLCSTSGAVSLLKETGSKYGSPQDRTARRKNCGLLLSHRAIASSRASGRS